MPWEDTGSTDITCIHCANRGYKNVKLINEMYFYLYDVENPNYDPDSTKKWPEPKMIKRKGHKVKNGKLLQRLKCPHIYCKHNRRNKRKRGKQ
jgi:hypothetical protein